MHSAGRQRHVHVAVFARNQVAQPVARFRRQYAYRRSCRHVLPVVTVAADAVNSRYRCHGEPCYTYPRTLPSVFLVQYHRPAERQRDMPRREGTPVGAVGSGGVYRAFQQISRAYVYRESRRRVDSKPFPRALSGDSGGFDGVCRCDRDEPQIIVDAVSVVALVLRRAADGNQNGND